ncbi:PAS domain S-box protein [Candidatus Lokiarchaeum ossiferum]|uniref:PAS domain S-box protein n=1 Tax=Candidatus Lokiarchaeum ossiferum TaxID=2951803 RepID=UPI00352D87BC
MDYNTLPVPYQSLDKNGNIIIVNDAWLELFGYDHEEIIGTWFGDLVHEDYLENFKLNFPRFQKEGKIAGIIFKMRQKSGNFIEISYNGKILYDTNHNFIRSSCIIDPKIKSTRNPRNPNLDTQINQILNSLPLGIRIVDRYFSVRYVNSIFLNIMGCDSEEVQQFTQKKCYIDFPTMICHTNKCVLRRIFAGEKIQGIEIKLKTKSSINKTVIKNATPYFDSNGDMVGIIEVVTDISLRKSLEQDQSITQRMETIGLLAGGIAHDFNNILTSILGLNSLLAMELEEHEDLQELCQEMDLAGNKAKKLANQLLTFAKGGAPIKKVLDLASTITFTSELVFKGTNCTYQSSIDPDLLPIYGDEAQIHQVLQNLLLNAVQAMSDGGVVKITAKNVHFDDLNSIKVPPGQYIYLSIEDTGVGIHKENASKIFDPYFTTKPHGTGLGLTTSYSIIKKHRGLLFHDDTYTLGAKFVIILPVSKEIVSETHVKTNFSFHELGKHILILEDQSMIQHVLLKILNKLGCTADFTQIDEDLLQKYDQSLLSHHRYDCVILDLIIPGKRGGKYVATQLLKVDPKVKIIISSGYSDDPFMANYQKHGIFAIIPKPYTIQNVYRVLSTL